MDKYDWSYVALAVYFLLLLGALLYMFSALEDDTDWDDDEGDT